MFQKVVNFIMFDINDVLCLKSSNVLMFNKKNNVKFSFAICLCISKTPCIPQLL